MGGQFPDGIPMPRVQIVIQNQEAARGISAAFEEAIRLAKAKYSDPGK
jgi:hypothetical protein